MLAITADERIEQAEPAIAYWAKRFANAAVGYDDLCQELRIIVFQSLGDFDEDRSSWTTYSAMKAKFGAIDVVRRHYSQWRMVPIASPHLIQANGSPVEDLQWSDLGESVAAEPLAVRAAFLWCCGLRQDEASEALGVTVSKYRHAISGGEGLRRLQKLYFGEVVQ